MLLLLENDDGKSPYYSVIGRLARMYIHTVRLHTLSNAQCVENVINLLR